MIYFLRPYGSMPLLPIRCSSCSVGVRCAGGGSPHWLPCGTGTLAYGFCDSFSPEAIPVRISVIMVSQEIDELV